MIEAARLQHLRNLDIAPGYALREMAEEIDRLTDLFNAINGVLIAHRECEIPFETADLAMLENYCRVALNYPAEFLSN